MQPINSSIYVSGRRADGTTSCALAVSAVFSGKPHRENGPVHMHEALLTDYLSGPIPSERSRSAGEDAFNPTGSAVDREALLAVCAGGEGSTDPEKTTVDLGAEALPRFVVPAGTHASV